MASYRVVTILPQESGHAGSDFKGCNWHDTVAMLPLGSEVRRLQDMEPGDVCQFPGKGYHVTITREV